MSAVVRGESQEEFNLVADTTTSIPKFAPDAKEKEK
jgi:hypothetical protein